MTFVTIQGAHIVELVRLKIRMHRADGDALQ